MLTQYSLEHWLQNIDLKINYQMFDNLYDFYQEIFLFSICEHLYFHVTYM